MTPFTTLTGAAVPYTLDDVDTDQILPSPFLKAIRRDGLGAGLFYTLRQNTSFILNQPRYACARILLAGANFGCGSSREHAPWALLDYGIRCVVAPRLAVIFQCNWVNFGLLPARVEREGLDALVRLVETDSPVLTVDLSLRRVTHASGLAVGLAISDPARDKLLGGLDSIGETLVHRGAIAAFEAKRATARPWLASEAPYD